MSDGSITQQTTVSDAPKPPSANTSPKSQSSPLTRAASYIQLSPEEPQKFPTRSDSLRRSFSENVLARTPSNSSRRHSMPDESSDYPSLEEDESRRESDHSVMAAGIAVSTFTLGDDDVGSSIDHRPASERPGGPITKSPVHIQAKRETSNKKTPEREQARHSVSGAISKFARRRSWIGTSRSPSPSRDKRQSEVESEANFETKGSDSHGGFQPMTQWNLKKDINNNTAQTNANGLERRGSSPAKRSRRPLSSLLNRNSAVETPAVPPIPNSYSSERLHILKHKKSNMSEVPVVPRSRSREQSQGSGTDSPRKRDDLWSVFRNLDGEYSKFQTRPSTTKTAVVRSALLPFLKTYADHPSILSLRAEDLDRRTVILNKWWTGLLEMLNGRYGESVSGNDRPAVLEATTALMVRPEWVATPPSMHVRTAKGLRPNLKSRSTTSLGSTMSEFLVDSVFHNVKNTFTQNLLAQMAYVVQKMSSRNVAASVVTFCGKAAAYAFFYCEGVAAILVRLWAIPTDTLRCVLSEYGISRADRLHAISDRVCTSYPACIHPLAFRSLQSTARYLRSRPHLPIATGHIPWHGPWVSRWVGKDTDLFFVFVKHFTDLLSRSMPDGLSPAEQIVSPGWALVQAQVLAVMRSTVQRSATSYPMGGLTGPPPTTFEDMLGEADTTATMLPLPASGHVRSMAENRVIMLLRDCLANSTLMTQEAQSIFADVFDRLLKATARNTSVFDHNACFTLCDFLEEAILILMRYFQSSAAKTITFDWRFWVDVSKQMLQSHNSMTEVRLFAFLFSMWGSMTKDDDTRRDICLGWLLTTETFQAEFNHWCPMVRAFFMRLLIWKVARPAAGGSSLDQTVLQALRVRLQEVWRNFLYLQQASEKYGLAAPSTSPCRPAPSRQLLIMRDDVQAVPSAMFLSFDGILSSAGNAKANPYEKHSSQNLNSARASLGSMLEENDRFSAGGRRKWGLLRHLIPFSSSTSVPDRRTSSQIRKSLANRSDTGDSSFRLPIKSDSSNGSVTVPYRSLSFKFSLEWVEKNKRLPQRAQTFKAPSLPLLAREYMEGRDLDIDLGQPCKPEGAAITSSKYAGRALAEWAFLVGECEHFFERRKAEGVPSNQLVETPSLNVDPFRRV